MTEPTEPIDPAATDESRSARRPSKDRTMFSPDTIRTLDALGFPLDPPVRHSVDRADRTDPPDRPETDPQ